MDRASLDSLIAAYGVAPSSDLALVISLELIQSSGIDEALPFVANIKAPVDDDRAVRLFDALLDSGHHNDARSFLDESRPSQQILLARCALMDGDTEAARKLYVAATKDSPDLASSELDNLYSVQRMAADGNPKNQKVKLRLVEKAEVVELATFVQPEQSSVNFDDVAGLVDVKKQINKKIILPFQKPSIYQRFKKKIGGGVLLYGPPGCGKTLIARATAGQCGAEFLNVEISDVLDMYIGESEQKLHRLFEKARASTPSVLFFDELEALAGKREHGRNSSGANIVSQFLSEMDGFAQNNQGVLTLASTNTPWAIDSAFLRPGRFDRMFFVPPPDKLARAEILRLELASRPCSSDINKDVIASNTSGFSGADISNLVETAADEAIEESLEQGGDVPISMAHIKQALAEIKPTTIEWLTTAKNYARYANDAGRYNDVLDFINKFGK